MNFSFFFSISIHTRVPQILFHLNVSKIFKILTTAYITVESEMIKLKNTKRVSYLIFPLNLSLAKKE